MVRVDLEYEGELHTRSVHAPSGAELATDAPTDNQGRGESFSPTDLVASALGSCMLTVMGIAARREGWALEGARASVEKHMVADPIRRVGRLDARIRMPSGLPAEARKILEDAARNCPVRKSVHPDIEVDLAFDYPD